jgi:hypothetical protein
MAIVALAFAMKTVVLAYFLINLDEDNHGDSGIPASASMDV